MVKIVKGLYVNKDNEKEIVYVSAVTTENGVVYTEALHPVSDHCVDAEEFGAKWKKVHRVEFVEVE